MGREYMYAFCLTAEFDFHLANLTGGKTRTKVIMAPLV